MSLSLSQLRSYIIFILTLLVFNNELPAQSRINIALQQKLDSILKQDQRFRVLSENVNPNNADSLSIRYHIPKDSLTGYFNRQQNLIDKENLKEIEVIIKRYGYPGLSLVGKPANVAAYYVIQHSNAIEKYFSLIKKAGEKKELPYQLVAMMQDRLLTQQGKPQLYGTQLWGHPVMDSTTGIIRPQFYFYPIKNIKNVNKRRKKAGFKSTLKEYAKEMGVSMIIKKPDFKQSDVNW